MAAVDELLCLPGDSVLVSAASQPPVPVPVKMKGVPASVWNTYLYIHSRGDGRRGTNQKTQRSALLREAPQPSGGWVVSAGWMDGWAGAATSGMETRQKSSVPPKYPWGSEKKLKSLLLTGDHRSCWPLLCGMFAYLESCSTSLKKGAKNGSLWFCPGTFMARSTLS